MICVCICALLYSKYKVVMIQHCRAEEKREREENEGKVGEIESVQNEMRKKKTFLRIKEVKVPLFLLCLSKMYI